MLPDKLIQNVEALKKALGEKVRRIDESQESIPTKARQIDETLTDFQRNVLKEYRLARIDGECDHPFSDFSGDVSCCLHCKTALPSQGRY